VKSTLGEVFVIFVPKMVYYALFVFHIIYVLSSIKINSLVETVFILSWSTAYFNHRGILSLKLTSTGTIYIGVNMVVTRLQTRTYDIKVERQKT
jgi:hypothetical protein